MLKSVKNKPGQILNWIAACLIILNIGLAAWLTLTNGSIFKSRSTERSAIHSLSRAELEDEKLRQEIAQLTLENERLSSSWQVFSPFTTLLTAIVAVAGVFVTIWKQFDERQRDRQQREFESRRRLDEKFTSIIVNISSDNRSLQMSSIVSLLTFLKPEYDTFHEQVYLILLANLKLKLDAQVNNLLVNAFEKALRIKLSTLRETAEVDKLDFSHTNLYRIDLSGLNLRELDIGFADLRHANMKDVNLFRVRGIEANLEKCHLTRANLGEARLVRANLAEAHLHQANLVAATLKEATLKGTQFYQAKMQSAHLESADITGAQFEQADLKDTYFIGSKFDQQVLRSILKAKNWDKAHFDEEITVKLAELNSKI